MMQFNALHYNEPNLSILPAVSLLSDLFGDLVEHLDGLVSTSEQKNYLPHTWKDFNGEL